MIKDAIKAYIFSLEKHKDEVSVEFVNASARHLVRSGEVSVALQTQSVR